MKNRYTALFLGSLIAGLVLICSFSHTVEKEEMDVPHFMDLLQPIELKADFNLLRTELDKYHPDMNLYTSREMQDSIVLEIQNDLNEEMTILDFYRTLNPFISSIRNNHTKVNTPNSFQKWFDTDALRLPFSFYPRNDSMFVLIDASDEYIIKEGAIILSINDKSVNDLYEYGRIFFPTDGYNVTMPDFRVTRNISSFYALAYGSPAKYEITYIDLQGALHSTTINAINKKKSFENLKDGRLYYKKEKGQLRFKIEEEVAILTIPSFFPSSERRFSNKLKKMFQQIRENNIEHLIIDIRGNGGGYYESAREVLKYLVSEPIKPFKYEYAIVEKIKQPHHFMDDYINHFNRKRLKETSSNYFSNSDKEVIHPHKRGYRGKVAILLDQRCASAAADFLGMTKSYTSAIHIGVESGGNPVAQVAVELPVLVLPHSDIRVQVPLFRTELNTTFPNIGRGLIPDIIVEPSIETVIGGIDEQMEQAKAVLRKTT